jgi:hypothetical protein
LRYRSPKALKNYCRWRPRRRHRRDQGGRLQPSLQPGRRWQPWPVNGGGATAGGIQSIAFANGANSDAQALGIGDIASVVNTGSAFDEAIAGSTSAAFRDNDLALIIGTGSTALSGSGDDWDIAAVFGDLLHASATGGNFLLDILPSL